MIPPPQSPRLSIKVLVFLHHQPAGVPPSGLRTANRRTYARQCLGWQLASTASTDNNLDASSCTHCEIRVTRFSHIQLLEHGGGRAQVAEAVEGDDKDGRCMMAVVPHDLAGGSADVMQHSSTRHIAAAL
jgi:hypothetical protein